MKLPITNHSSPITRFCFALFAAFAVTLSGCSNSSSGLLASLGIKPSAAKSVAALQPAAEIYRGWEWTSCRCDDLPEGYDSAVFDIAVNNGAGEAVRLLQRSLNEAGDLDPALTVDGFIGPKTIAAAAAGGVPGLRRLLLNRQKLFYDIVQQHPGGGGGLQPIVIPIVTSAALAGSSKWQVTMIVTATTDTTTTPTSTIELTWFQAETYARSGGKIARAGWVDRYLFHQNSLWWLQQFNAVTKALGTLAVVQAGDFGPAEFRATDWTPAVGETITSGQLTALQTVTTVFP